MAVFVLDKHKKPLMPCSEKRARIMLIAGRARVHHMYPFTIRLVDRVGGTIQPITLKIDPGSKQTGIALVRQTEDQANVIALAEVKHRGQAISKGLKQRAGYRRRRRSANLRYRAPRFDNRRRPEGWLPPSIQHRVDADLSVVKRLKKLAPVSSLAQELVRFDTQLMENPEITGVGYQQGTLAGYEVREYVFTKWGRKCVYCDKEDVPLNLDHVRPRSRGGSNRVANLVPACIRCNQLKDDADVREFLKAQPARLERIFRELKTPLKDATAVNATRWTMFRALKALGLPTTTGTGGRTKWNRHHLSIPKAHALDAVCVGNMDATAMVNGWQQPSLLVVATGRGSYQRTLVTRYGFPRGYLKRSKVAFGFQTGDMVKAVVLNGKKTGSYLGRVAVRASGFFNVQTSTGVIQGISNKACRSLQRADGYNYSLIAHSRKGERDRGHAPHAALSLPGINARVSRAKKMKEIVAVIFGLGLLCNALLFVPQVLAVWRKKTDEGISLITFGGFSVLQVIGVVHGIYQRDPSLILGMAASFLSCGTVSALTLFYRRRRLKALN